MKVTEEQVKQMIRLLDLLCNPNTTDKVDTKYVLNFIEDIKKQMEEK